MNVRIILGLILFALWLASFTILPPTITNNALVFTIYIVLGFIAVIFMLVGGSKRQRGNWE